MYEYDKLKYCPKCKGKLLRKRVDERKRLVCSLCGYIIYRNALPAVNAIIEKEKKILLTKRAFQPFKNYWGLPGGFIEYEETPKQALKREILEELGLKAKIKKLHGVYLSKSNYANVILDVFLVDIPEVKIKVGSDIKEAKFFNFENLPGKIAFKAHLKAIKDYIKNGR